MRHPTTRPNDGPNDGSAADHQGGFSLIETIVALALFDGMFVIVNHGLATNWQGVRRADRETAATALASALLASAGVEAPLIDGARTAGQQDGFNWQLSVDRYREPERDQRAELGGTDAIRNPNGSLAAYWVGVTVVWPSGPLQTPRLLRFRTLKLGRS